jgi:S-adenosylmethionine:tRNA ribosyltransferase-isomerase
VPTAYRRTDFAYELPPELVAQTPLAERGDARLLVAVAWGLADRQFRDLAELLPPAAVVVVNDARVIPARLRARKPTGGAVELLLLERAKDGGSGERWSCLARSRRRLRPGQSLTLTDARGAAQGPALTIVSARAADREGAVVVELPGPVDEILAAWGDLPLPPYIERPAGATAEDRERYQTVFARVPGAIAAPTAGLHFSAAMLARLEARGCVLCPLTLHVGAGTFAPVRSDDLDRHTMHAERYDIPAATASAVASGRPVVAIGTTVVRALESAAHGDHALAAGPGTTRLFIRPGFRFRIVDRLLTNFHLPESTLLMLVCAFAGTERVLAAYRHAVEARYRFFSYGDASLWSPAPALVPAALAGPAEPAP